MWGIGKVHVQLRCNPALACITASHLDLTNLSPSERLNCEVLDGNEVELWSTAQILIYAGRLCLLQGAGGPRSLNFLSVLPMGEVKPEQITLIIF